MFIIMTQVPMRCLSIALILNLISLIFLKQVRILHFDCLPLDAPNVIYWYFGSGINHLKAISWTCTLFPTLTKTEICKSHSSLYLQGLSPEERRNKWILPEKLGTNSSGRCCVHTYTVGLSHLMSLTNMNSMICNYSYDSFTCFNRNSSVTTYTPFLLLSY